MMLEEITYGEILFNEGACTILSQSAVSVEFLLSVELEDNYLELSFIIDNTNPKEVRIIPESDDKRIGWNRYSFACLLKYEQGLNRLEPRDRSEHKRYTREGMIKRVLQERRLKADKADYKIKWADNIYGDHVLTNEKGVKYKIYLRDFENEIGYSDSADAKYNKLGTTKHIMFAFKALKENPNLMKRLKKTPPFIEIYCDPLNDYKVSWFYKGELPLEEKRLITKFFNKKTYIEDSQIESLLEFTRQAIELDMICIRPEVVEKVERYFEGRMLEIVKNDYALDYTNIHGELFPYQKEGVEFAVFRKAAIIADEMGLGKTIQAIVTAVLKKQIFEFKKTLVICPATLKAQWKKEIEQFTDEKATVVLGTPFEREQQYLSEDSFFYIVNYETVLRDSSAINRAGFDFVILDEAQKVKNYETKTAYAVNRLNISHKLVITGTPIENRLIDIYSIVKILDPYFFGPLWEFSYNHCEFDPEKPNKINGYYNLNSLNAKLSQILIRREKSMVLSQLPAVQQFDVPCELGVLQEEFHGSYMSAVSAIVRKKYLTPYDLQRLTLLLNCARMVCDSTYLVDDKTSESPKLVELEDILFEKLDIEHANRKIIIFSEWIKVHSLIGQLLRKHNIGFVELNGSVPVKHRGDLIKRFETDDNCKIFLSTEAGGAGLNLQVADILINFELPWNPAKKNQRIGRIDRLGQKSKKLTIYNLITQNSIEQQIAAGLLVKQNLFDGVLSNSSATNYVDFSTKGRSQFIQQIEELIKQQELSKTLEFADIAEEKIPLKEPQEIEQLDLFEEPLSEQEQEQEKESTDLTSSTLSEKTQQAKEMEEVMNNGMQFLASLLKMSTGKDMGLENQQIEVNAETGEVVMRFKMNMS
ncbi:DEAD/DEAH box helicase [Bacteroidales bacterium OttesenSCG-928-I14]|nr:DEAD/DEAH box helicase [Bacteroidales bacterium OttesenSCG-928-I14]